MDISHYMFAGVTLALSILGFFLKKNKIEIDNMKDRMRELEISDARSSERIKTLLKLTEDRRRDIQKIFDKINS